MVRPLEQVPVPEDVPFLEEIDRLGLPVQPLHGLELAAFDKVEPVRLGPLPEHRVALVEIFGLQAFGQLLELGGRGGGEVRAGLDETDDRGVLDERVEIGPELGLPQEKAVEALLADGHEDARLDRPGGLPVGSAGDDRRLTEVVPFRPDPEIDLFLALALPDDPDFAAEDEVEHLANIALVVERLAGRGRNRFGDVGELGQLLIRRDRKERACTQETEQAGTIGEGQGKVVRGGADLEIRHRLRARELGMRGKDQAVRPDPDLVSVLELDALDGLAVDGGPVMTVEVGQDIAVVLPDDPGMPAGNLTAGQDEVDSRFPTDDRLVLVDGYLRGLGPVAKDPKKGHRRSPLLAPI
jgi:hypothetical protein